MSEELEKTIKRLKILECDCIYFENGKCTYNKNKCQREQDIETALNYIENSIPKEKVVNKIKDLVIEEESEYFDNRKTIKILQELLEKK